MISLWTLFCYVTQLGLIVQVGVRPLNVAYQ